MSDDEPTPELFSAVYHALRTRRRRQVIQILSDSEERVHSVRSLAKRITAIEEDIPQDRATGKPYRNAYNALSQTHLSTLADAGLIIYDPDRQTVEIGPRFQLAVLFLHHNRVTFQALEDNELSDTDEWAP